MVSNRQIRRRTIEEIDIIVSRILHDLGNPTSPIDLADVRYILKLDKTYYTSNDPGLLDGVMHRLRVAGIQIFNRPGLILDAVKKLSLKALYLPDQRRIYLDGDLPVLKHRWNEAHEIGHSILPWHNGVMLGDNGKTLSLDCREQIETEANYTAGRLLFLGEQFAQFAADLNPSIDSIKLLHKQFGNSLTSTFYKFIEQMGDTQPLVGLISPHPHPFRRDNGFDPTNPCRYFVRSKAFLSFFSKITDLCLFQEASKYCSAKNGGLIGECDLRLCDDNGQFHSFHFETFFNRYDALTLGVYLKPL